MSRATYYEALRRIPPVLSWLISHRAFAATSPEWRESLQGRPPPWDCRKSFFLLHCLAIPKPSWCLEKKIAPAELESSGLLPKKSPWICDCVEGRNLQRHHQATARERAEVLFYEETLSKQEKRKERNDRKENINAEANKCD